MTNTALSKLMETIPLPMTSLKKKTNQTSTHISSFMCVISCLLSSVFQAAGATNRSQAPFPWDLIWFLIPTSRAFNLTARVREALLHPIIRNRNMRNEVIRKRGSPIPSSLPELMVNYTASPWCFLQFIDLPWALCGQSPSIDIDHSCRSSNQRCWRNHFANFYVYRAMIALISKLNDLKSNCYVKIWMWLMRMND